MTIQVTPQRLGTLLRPRSVALVGAADKSGFSLMAYRNLVDFGLAEHTHLVNRRGAAAHGRATVTSCTQIAEPVDLAFMMVPRAATLDALSDAAAAGIRHALVLSSGYADAGAAGQRAQADLVAHAEALGVLLVGPNHLGFANFVDQVPVTAIPGLPRAAGPVALVSQSGMAASAMLDFATMTGVGLSYLVTLGNEAMVAAGHVLDYLVGDPHTRAVALFLETIRDPVAFARAARRAAAAGKAVVVLKSGRSELSARAAAAHSGAAVGDDRHIDEFLHDLGVIRVEEIEDLILTAGAAAHLGRLARPGIGVVSISGGACDMLADHAAVLGAPLPALAPATRAALARCSRTTAPCRTRWTSPGRRSSTRVSSPGASRPCPRTRRSAWSRSSTACPGRLTGGRGRARCSPTRSGRGRPAKTPGGLREPGDAADHGLHPRGDGPGRHRLRDPRPAPHRRRPAQHRLVVRSQTRA